MKSVFLFLGVTLNVFIYMYTQTFSNEMIIDPNSPSNYVIDITDTILYCNEYELDLDHNDSIDFTFTAQCSWGGMGGTESITIKASDGSAFALDSSVIEGYGYYDSNGDPVTTIQEVMEVKIYNFSDTLHLEDCQSTNAHYIVKRGYGNFPALFNYHLWDNWISGIHFIGFRKEMNNTVYLGWIKVDVLNFYMIKILEFALNSPILMSFQFYPNPVQEELNVKGVAVNTPYQIFDPQGIVQQEGILENGTISMTTLPAGFYFLNLGGRTKPFIKQ